jgi:hypothetical protein
MNCTRGTGLRGGLLGLALATTLGSTAVSAAPSWERSQEAAGGSWLARWVWSLVVELGGGQSRVQEKEGSVSDPLGVNAAQAPPEATESGTASATSGAPRWDGSVSDPLG